MQDTSSLKDSLTQNSEFQDLQNKDSYIECVNIWGTQAQDAANYGYILTARTVALEIIAVGAKWETQGSNVGARLDVVKVSNGSAISAGTSILAATFNIGSSSTANTWVYKEGIDLSTIRGIRYLKYGESIALTTRATTLTNVAGMHICLYYRPANNGSYR